MIWENISLIFKGILILDEKSICVSLTPMIHISKCGKVSNFEQIFMIQYRRLPKCIIKREKNDDTNLRINIRVTRTAKNYDTNRENKICVTRTSENNKNTLIKQTGLPQLR